MSVSRLEYDLVLFVDSRLWNPFSREKEKGFHNGLLFFRSTIQGVTDLLVQADETMWKDMSKERIKCFHWISFEKIEFENLSSLLEFRYVSHIFLERTASNLLVHIVQRHRARTVG